ARPLQSTKPSVQAWIVHSPSTHALVACCPPHATSHAPQCAASLDKSTQRPPQHASTAAQAAEQPSERGGSAGSRPSRSLAPPASPPLLRSAPTRESTGSLLRAALLASTRALHQKRRARPRARPPTASQPTGPR